jgi:hypothetical protein
LRQRTHARAHALVGWLSGRLDLSVRPCRRARGGGCGSGSSLTRHQRGTKDQGCRFIQDIVWIETQGHEEKLREQDLLQQQESIQKWGRLQVQVLRE